MGILYVIATPIGNLKDITFRALEVLKEANLILAEDTRVTKKLLARYQIDKPIKRYDENVGPKVDEEIKERLQRGQQIALVSDAGTPAIADPGARLVSYIRSQLSDVRIIPIPGASALTTALSVAGLNANQFTFLGYPPHKKGRQKFFSEFKEIKIRPVVIYESPHRLQKTLNNLSGTFGEDYEIIIARELTKIYEEIYKNSIKNALMYFQGERQKGEFVIIVP